MQDEITEQEYKELHANDQPIIQDTTTPVVEPDFDAAAPKEPTLDVDEATGFPAQGLVVADGDNKEVIIHDTDENGETVGWHKEAI